MSRILRVLLICCVAWPATAEVAPKVPWYAVKPDLSNISNRKQLPKLTRPQQQHLVTNAFVVRPTVEEQLFYLYETNNYRDQPSIVTTDSVLHTYHIFFSFMLRWLEREKLLPVLRGFCDDLLKRQLQMVGGTHPPLVQEALARNIAFLAVPASLLGGQVPPLPDAAQKLLTTELERIKAHAKREDCLTGSTLDYTQFIPRGHYTRSQALSDYFLAMMWLGLVPLDLDAKNPTAVVQALLLTEQLAGNADFAQRWQAIYDPTAFFVGKADDLTFREFAPVVREVYGSGDINRFGDAAKVADFLKAAEKLPRPQIAGAVWNGSETVIQGPQFRLLGQRYIPDSRMLQELTYPRVGTLAKPRHFPRGLDVMAVLGSSRAAELLDKVYGEPAFEHYLSQRGKLQAEFGKLTTADWQQNLYFGWLYSLQPLLTVRPAGYPAFMRNTAWRDKSLITALSSWTQLRHDTVLYGKQSVAEAGGAEEPPPPAGYVEPEPELYVRLRWLSNLTRTGLQGHGYITKDDDVWWAFDRFETLLGDLARISRKELTGVVPDETDLNIVKWFGGELESIMLNVAQLADPDQAPARWDLISSKTDRNMALATDVHTSFDQVLQEAIGPACELWVVAPFKNRLLAFRGATFSYWEFVGPAAERLTDEAWQEALAIGKAPAQPDWVRKVILPPGPTKSEHQAEVE
ncbi:MAG: DUF3160 domain-containing protein [Fimbriimonadaceae bacterium]|nr:DUF3160 domain-containing protein [Fimbriimonadaceae bacterium]